MEQAHLYVKSNSSVAAEKPHIRNPTNTVKSQKRLSSPQKLGARTATLLGHSPQAHRHLTITFCE